MWSVGGFGEWNFGSDKGVAFERQWNIRLENHHIFKAKGFLAIINNVGCSVKKQGIREIDFQISI